MDAIVCKCGELVAAQTTPEPTVYLYDCKACSSVQYRGEIAERMESAEPEPAPEIRELDPVATVFRRG